MLEVSAPQHVLPRLTTTTGTSAPVGAGCTATGTRAGRHGRGHNSDEEWEERRGARAVTPVGQWGGFLQC